MARKYIESDIPSVEPKIKEGVITQVRTYKLITPLFGGGAKPQEPDAVTTVRGSEVRGHLRFWWRATRGGMFEGDLAEMKAAEEKIWGSAAGENKPGPSLVKIFINKTTARKGNQFQAVDRNNHNIPNIGNPSSKDGYVAFPLRDSANPVVWENVEFEVEIKYPKEIKKDIVDALWAWETFGGIGARTRRGFGALQCIRIDGKPFDIPSSNDLTNHINTHIPSNAKWHAGVPHLSISQNRYVILSQGVNSNAIGVWRDLINRLQSFRQSRNGRFGRSLWPEPDEIRRKTGDYLNPRHIPNHSVEKFPRAKFGLPIIFEFKREDARDGDPQKTTLQGAEHDRLASPLILRPIICSDGVARLATILEWEPINSDESNTPPGGLLLTSNDYADIPVKSELNTNEANNIRPLNGNPDVLQAFLNSLR